MVWHIVTGVINTHIIRESGLSLWVWGPKKKKTWILGEFEVRRATRHQDWEWGTHSRDGVRTGVSERLSSDHPVTTSVWCVWTQVHAGVVVICSDQPVCDRCVVFGFVVWWKEGFVRMCNRNFMSLLMMGRWYREWEEKPPWSMEFELCSLYVTSSNNPNLCIYVLYYVLYYIISLCSGGFVDATTDMCWFGVWWGYVTDVSRTGCARLGSTTRHVSFYASLVGGGLRL